MNKVFYRFASVLITLAVSFLFTPFLAVADENRSHSKVALVRQLRQRLIPPTRWDWRDQGVVTPVKGQGRASCATFSAVAALEAWVMIHDSGALPQGALFLDISEQAVICRELGGSLMNAYMAFIEGVPIEGCPQTPCNPLPGCPRFYIGGWDMIPQTVEAIKAAVLRQPVAVTFAVFWDFIKYSGGIYAHASGAYYGEHAGLIVGYDDEAQCFIVKNSWGEGWGEAGYFRIAYSEVNSDVEFGGYAATFTPPKPQQPQAAPAHRRSAPLPTLWGALRSRAAQP